MDVRGCGRVRDFERLGRRGGSARGRSPLGRTIRERAIPLRSLSRRRTSNGCIEPVPLSRALAGRPIEGTPFPRPELAASLPSRLDAARVSGSDIGPLIPGDPDCSPEFPENAETYQNGCEDVVADCTVAIRSHPSSGRLYIERGDA